MRRSAQCLLALAALAAACNALFGIDEAGPIRGQAADASVSGSSGVGGGAGSSSGGTSSGGVGGSAGVGGAPSCDANVSNDPDNCGACGHSCQGDDCAGGRCQPVLVTQVPFNLDYLTVTADQILASGVAGSAIVRVPKADYGQSETWVPAGVTLGYDTYSPVIVRGQEILFAHYEGFAIYRADPTSLASATKIVTTSIQPGDVLADGNAIYWSVCGGGFFEAPAGGGSESVLGAEPDCAYRIALDAGTIWATSASTGSLFRVSTSDGTAAEFSAAPAASKAYALAVAPTHVYFATYDQASDPFEYDGRLYRIEKSAGSGVEPELLQGGTVFDGVFDMTVADGFLYFVIAGSAAGLYKDGRVLRVPLADPNATPEPVVENREYPAAVAVDDKYVYWVDGLEPGWGDSQIWRVAK